MYKYNNKNNKKYAQDVGDTFLFLGSRWISKKDYDNIFKYYYASHPSQGTFTHLLSQL